MAAFISLLIFLFVVIFWYIFGFNKLIKAKQNVYESWADIDVQLNRRHNLIPNLINVVKDYTRHEKYVLEKVAQLRSEAIKIDKDNISEKSTVENYLEKSLHKLLAVVENYPDLKANDNFLKLQVQLSETEDQIASSRRIYNSNVSDYNTKTGIFPLNIIAKINNFQTATFFQLN